MLEVSSNRKRDHIPYSINLRGSNNMMYTNHVMLAWSDMHILLGRAGWHINTDRSVNKPSRQITQCPREAHMDDGRRPIENSTKPEAGTLKSHPFWATTALRIGGSTARLLCFIIVFMVDLASKSCCLCLDYSVAVSLVLRASRRTNLAVIQPSNTSVTQLHLILRVDSDEAKRYTRIARLHVLPRRR